MIQFNSKLIIPLSVCMEEARVSSASTPQSKTGLETKIIKCLFLIEKVNSLADSRINVR
jgi:hypothetical protein